MKLKIKVEGDIEIEKHWIETWTELNWIKVN